MKQRTAIKRLCHSSRFRLIVLCLFVCWNYDDDRRQNNNQAKQQSTIRQQQQQQRGRRGRPLTQQSTGDTVMSQHFDLLDCCMCVGLLVVRLFQFLFCFCGAGSECSIFLFLICFMFDLFVPGNNDDDDDNEDDDGNNNTKINIFKHGNATTTINNQPRQDNDDDVHHNNNNNNNNNNNKTITTTTKLSAMETKTKMQQSTDNYLAIMVGCSRWRGLVAGELIFWASTAAIPFFVVATMVKQQHFFSFLHACLNL
jgi:hypothetical protein